MQNTLPSNEDNTNRNHRGDSGGAGAMGSGQSLLYSAIPSGSKRPKKGILKSSSSFDQTGGNVRKSAKFDELNVLQTFHPADKDYGHMKIDEPKTPYNYMEPDPARDFLDAELLAEKLRIAANTNTPSFGDDDASDEEFEETHDEKARRLEFEKRRKEHYKEFAAVKLARKLIQEELAAEETENENVQIVVEDSEKSIVDTSSGLEECEEEHDPTPTDANQFDEGNITVQTITISPKTSRNTMDVDQPLPDKHPCKDKQYY